MKLNPTAMAIDQHLQPTSINVSPILHSIEDTFNVVIKISHTGCIVFPKSQKTGIVYKQGGYTAEKAVGAEQCASFRFQLICFLRWAMVNMNTPELEKNRAWINDQLH